VAEVVLPEEAERIRLPDVVGQDVRMIRPIVKVKARRNRHLKGG
jgi:hypothetical protein